VSELSQEQQLQAAVLADMWQVPDVSTAVVQAFTVQATSSSGLSEAARQQLLRMPAHPECLQPLLKHVLLAMLGDLEAVWADAALQEVLLKLPLHVMELLLSLDDLTVSPIRRTAVTALVGTETTSGRLSSVLTSDERLLCAVSGFPTLSCRFATC
jgi:hypothetical protein